MSIQFYSITIYSFFYHFLRVKRMHLNDHAENFARG